MRSRRWLSFFFPALIFFLSFNPSAFIFVNTEKLYAPDETLSGHTVDTLSSRPADFLWPTDASHIVTSTFGEYRHTHFHSGIDISTYNTSGYKVFAAQGGYVWRIQVSPNGYGKMLFVKHYNGFSTAYAHLKTFNEKINAIVREEQVRLERYPVEIVLDSALLKVEKGEIIAYTGRTGSGSPHLHFEVRDEGLNPVNPMNYKNLTVPDSLSPSVRSISISPLDEYSRIGRSHHQIVVRPFGQKHHMYNVPRKIFVQGKIGLGINARDGISGTYHPVGIYRLESYLDDSLIFATRFDRLLADGSKQILMYYDFPLMRMGRGRFQKLYVDQEPTLPMYDHLSGTAGIIDADKLDEGTHRFRIVVKDVHDNAAEVHGLLVSEHQTAIDSVRTKGKPEKRVQKNLAETPYDSLTIHPEMHGWFTFDNNMFEIVYDSGSVFQPLALHVEKEQGNKTTIYRVEPHDVVLNKGIRLFVRPHGTFRGPVALYGRDRRRWELLPTTFDSSTGYFSTSLTQTLGDIALLEDTHPPVIGAVKIKTSGGKPAIHCRVYDDRSGVDANEIKMYIDDVFVIPEIDGERWRVRYEADHRLSAGWHALRIVAKDKMKNESSLTRTFAVTR